MCGAHGTMFQILYHICLYFDVFFLNFSNFRNSSDGASSCPSTPDKKHRAFAGTSKFLFTLNSNYCIIQLINLSEID